MSDAVPSAELERSCRRWLACYPRWFRREHEGEIVELLVSGARPGQRRLDHADCAALIRGAALIWLRPRLPATSHTARVAVRLVYLVAAAELAVAAVVGVTANQLRAAIVARDPSYTTHSWHAEVTGALDPLIVRAVLMAVLVAALAWNVGRGRAWAGALFVVVFGVTVVSLIAGVQHGSATYAQADLAAGGALVLLQLAAASMLVRAAVKAHASHRHRPALDSMAR